MGFKLKFRHIFLWKYILSDSFQRSILQFKTFIEHCSFFCQNLGGGTFAPSVPTALDLYFESRPASCLAAQAPPCLPSPTIPQYIDWRPNKVNGLIRFLAVQGKKSACRYFYFFLLYNFPASTFVFFTLFIHDLLGYVFF